VIDAVEVELTDPGGVPLRIEWRAEALAAFEPASPGAEPVWRLGGELDWDEVEALRILSGRLDDDRVIAIAALRPSGAAGHGEEIVTGALGTLDALDPLAETLFSTEYGPDRLPRRIGLELYREEGGLPIRVAGDATATASDDHGGVRRLSAALALRSSGAEGPGVLDVLTRSR
jgi:hypothetical protein